MMQTNRDERACERRGGSLRTNATVRARRRCPASPKAQCTRICPNVFGRSTGCCMKRCGSFSSRTRRNGTCAAATPPEENTCTPGRTSPKREKYTAEKYTKRDGLPGPRQPENHFFRPERTPCSSEHTAPARPPKTTIPIFFPPCQIPHLFYGTSIPHCVTHKTDSRDVFINQHGVIKRKKSEKTARNILLFVSVFRIMCLKLYIREG